MNESELQKAVFALLGDRPALMWHHCSDARRCRGQTGFPDLVIVGRRAAFRELKGEDTRVRLYQQEYGSALMSAGSTWAVWRPADLLSGRIEAELDALM